MLNHVVIVALPIGNEVYIYKDGDEVPIHQTMVYLGDLQNISPIEAGLMQKVISDIAEKTSPFVAKVSGTGFLGKDSEQIILTEAQELQDIRDKLIANELIAETMNSVDEQHPTWVSHISTLRRYKYGDPILFNRLGFWYGEERKVFNFDKPGLIRTD